MFKKMIVGGGGGVLVLAVYSFRIVVTSRICKLFFLFTELSSMLREREKDRDRHRDRWREREKY